MPLHIAPVRLSLCDQPTLRFFAHCIANWDNMSVCTNAHVSFMKHMFRQIFHLPVNTALIGTRFSGDNTLAMINYDSPYTFYTIQRTAFRFRAAVVTACGFVPKWESTCVGFYAGLNAADGKLRECFGPTEDDEERGFIK